DAIADIGLDQHMRLAVSFLGTVDRADIERGMRPGRLGEIFDNAGDTIVAFDQEHVARLDQIAQKVGIAGRERLIARYLLLKVAGKQLADHVEHDAHLRGSPRGRPFRTALSLFLSCAKPVAIWFMHRSGSIMIDSPWRLPRVSEYGK